MPEDIASYVHLRNQLSMPIAGGENEHTLFGYRELLAAGAVDIAQPDLGSCGGITAARHIIALAHAHGVQVNPHVWGSAVAQAASLQVMAAIPVTHHSLFASQPVLEYDRSAHPFRRQLVAEPMEIVDGVVPIPKTPGLGIEVERGPGAGLCQLSADMSDGLGSQVRHACPVDARWALIMMRQVTRRACWTWDR